MMNIVSFLRGLLVAVIAAIIVVLGIAFSYWLTPIPTVITEKAPKNCEPIVPYDEFIVKTCSLLGTPYFLGGHGTSTYANRAPDGHKIDVEEEYYKTYNNFDALSVGEIHGEGIDCSGLIYWTLSSLGCKTYNFLYNNPNPYYTGAWLSYKDRPMIEYNGKKVTIPILKEGIHEDEMPYYEMENGTLIPSGSIVVVPPDSNHAGHMFIYLGEFKTRQDLLDYLHKLGINRSLDKYVFDYEPGSTHWKLESAGRKGFGKFRGVQIDNITSTSSTKGYKRPVTVYSILVPEIRGIIH